MAFPEEVLADQEELVLHLHPHWKTAIRPALIVLLALATTVFAWVMLPQAQTSTKYSNWRMRMSSSQ